MAHLDPLAYLVGLEGFALLRAFGGEHDREFVAARLAEVRALLDDPAVADRGVDVSRVDTVDGYRVWSATYDEPGNGIFGYEEPYVDAILNPLPPGVALDAACGTGRWAARLADRGHRVIGVDSSPDMLAKARARVPGADFRAGTLEALPLDDGSVDVVTCGLALTHVPSLAPVMAEFARVLTPGGHLIVSDVHHLMVLLGSVPKVVGPDGILPAHRHQAGDYLQAALGHGLALRSCVEPRLAGGDRFVGSSSPPATFPVDPAAVGAWNEWPWTLHPLVPAAAGAANVDLPATVVWHFERS